MSILKWPGTWLCHLSAHRQHHAEIEQRKVEIKQQRWRLKKTDGSTNKNWQQDKQLDKHLTSEWGGRLLVFLGIRPTVRPRVEPLADLASSTGSLAPESEICAGKKYIQIKLSNLSCLPELIVIWMGNARFNGRHLLETWRPPACKWHWGVLRRNKTEMSWSRMEGIPQHCN